MMMEATLSARDAGSKPVIRSARRLERRSMMLWLLPPVAWFTVFMLLPYALLFYYSLGHSQDMRFVPGFSFHNFVRVFTDEPYLGVILKSARIGLMTSILSALVAYPLAFALAFHVRSAAVKFALYLLVIVPWWASYLVKAYAWKTILGTGGILNATLQGLGVTDEPVREEARLFETIAARFPESPRLVFVNKTDTWPLRYTAAEQQLMRQHLRRVLSPYVHYPADIVFGHCSHIESGQRVADEVPELLERIYSQTNELGELAALLDPAGIAVGVSARIKSRLREVRTRVAESYVKAFAGIAAATGLIPAPGVDVAAFAASQVGMVLAIAHCFNLHLSRREARQVALTIAKQIGTTLGGWAIYVGGVMVVDSLLNLIPGVGGWLSNLLIGAARTAGVGYWTYLLGRVAIEYFAAEMLWDGEQFASAILRIHESLAAEWFGREGGRRAR